MCGQLTLIGGEVAGNPWQPAPPPTGSGNPGLPTLATRGGSRPHWLFLPLHLQGQHHAWLQPSAPADPLIFYGRAMVIHAFRALQIQQQPLRIIACNPQRPAWICPEWRPASSGLELVYSAIDDPGQSPGNSAALWRNSVRYCPQPSRISCPGQGRKEDLGNLWPHLHLLGNWPLAHRDFAEARWGELDSVGSWYRLWQLQCAWQRGEWHESAITLEMDSKAMAGVAIVNYRQGTA